MNIPSPYYLLLHVKATFLFLHYDKKKEAMYGMCLLLLDSCIWCNRKLMHWLLYTQSIAFAFGAVGTSENQKLYVFTAVAVQWYLLYFVCNRKSGQCLFRIIAFGICSGHGKLGAHLCIALCMPYLVFQLDIWWNCRLWEYVFYCYIVLCVSGSGNIGRDVYQDSAIAFSVLRVTETWGYRLV